MTYLGLLIAGLSGMLFFWLLALLLWWLGPIPRAAPGRDEKTDWHDQPTVAEPLPSAGNARAIPMQFRRLQSGAAALFSRQSGDEDDRDQRARRNCMMVDAGENARVDDGEIERRATAIFIAHEDSPRPRTGREGQDLATRPFKRARPHLPQAASKRED